MNHKVIGFALAALLLPSIAWGQDFGAINGTVTDPSGAVVPNVQITVTQTATGVASSTISNGSGVYNFPALPPTTYSMKVVATGFQQLNRAGILLLANDHITIDIKLVVGSATQVVTVGANELAVNTTSPTISEVVDTSRINGLPLNGRNVAQLTELAAGTVSTPSSDANEGSTKTLPAAVTEGSNGGLGNSSGFFLDGVPNTDFLSNVNLPFPMPDATQEFSLQTSDYSAEFGDNSGAVVQVVTKSGTNQFHGDAFDYLRNDIFNSRTYFAKAVDPLHREQFGGTIGGPVLRDKLFFFFGYQGTRQSDVTNGLSAYVPTDANISGDFSNYLTVNADNPLGKAIDILSPSGTPYPDNQIPTSSFNPASVALLNYLPRATGDGHITYSEPVVIDENEYTARGDYAISVNDHLMARYFSDTYAQPGEFSSSNFLTYTDYSQFWTQNVAITETHIFSPVLLNDLTFGYEHEDDSRGSPPGAFNVASLGVSISQAAVPGIDEIDTSGYFDVDTFDYASFPRQGFTESDTLRWEVGRNSLAFGASLEHDSLIYRADTNQNGLFVFQGNYTGSALADFFLGDLQSFAQGNGYLQSKYYYLPSMFMEDSFEQTHRLTWTYGVRWQPALPWHDRDHVASGFSPANYALGIKSIVYPNAYPGEIFEGDPGMYPLGRPTNWFDIGPRLGFAYDVFKNGKTSIRGGIGEFYASRTSGFASDRTAQSEPFSIDVTLTKPNGKFNDPYLGVTDPFPAPLPVPHSVTFSTPLTVYAANQNDHRLGANITNWNITLEQELPGKVLLRIGGVWSRSAHINANEELNPTIYAPGDTLSTSPPRYYQPYSEIIMSTNSVGARYNSLQVTLQKRVSNRFTLVANYTMSQNTDDLPNNTDVVDWDDGAQYALPVTFPNFKYLDTGPSQYDTPQAFNGSYVWALPNLPGANAAVRSILGGWSWTGIVTLQDGTPINVLSGLNESLTTIGYDRAELTGQPVYSSSRGRSCGTSSSCIQWLNQAAFAQPALGTFGDAPKATAWGPGFFDWDMGAMKTFPIREATNLQFQAQYFNVFNHPSFANPAASVSGAGLGEITAINANATARIAQFALKVEF